LVELEAVKNAAERSVMKTAIWSVALATILSLTFSGSALAQQHIPAAIYQDPPVNAKYPASSGGIRFDIHGTWINGFVFVPAGSGAHPTAILLHGLPGTEQNLDLARALQRAGWTVITFHYRGSWGSGGTFTLSGGMEDADVVLDQLRNAATAKALHADPARIILIGHSYGGYVAAQAAASHPAVHAVVLIAPLDISYAARAWSRLTPARRRTLAEEVFNDVDGRLTGADAQSLVNEIVQSGSEFDLSTIAEKLRNRKLLVITATNDNPAVKALGLPQALGNDPNVRYVQMNTDHAFDDHRIALEATILNWLSKL
jgi:pimeloyl-ACP methyl ester carboxylesterase